MPAASSTANFGRPKRSPAISAMPAEAAHPRASRKIRIHTAANIENTVYRDHFHGGQEQTDPGCMIQRINGASQFTRQLLHFFMKL